MRRCGFCAGELRWLTGDETSARERAGNAIDRNGPRPHHRRVVSERFSGDSAWWGVREKPSETWAALTADRWPRS